MADAVAVCVAIDLALLRLEEGEAALAGLGDVRPLFVDLLVLDLALDSDDFDALVCLVDAAEVFDFSDFFDFLERPVFSLAAPEGARDADEPAGLLALLLVAVLLLEESFLSSLLGTAAFLATDDCCLLLLPLAATDGEAAAAPAPAAARFMILSASLP